MSNIFAMALGCGSKNRDDQWLEVFYPDPVINPDSKLVDVVSEEVGYEGGNAALELTHRQIQHLAREWRDAGFEHEASYAVAFQESERPVVLTILESDAEPASTPEAYLKLHLLSHRLVRPTAWCSAVFSRCCPTWPDQRRRRGPERTARASASRPP